MATRRRAEPSPALVWIGDGDRYVVGVPARDLTESDIAALAGDGDRAALIAALIGSGCYGPADSTEDHSDG